MSNDEQNPESTEAPERVLGPGASGDIEQPAAAPEGSMPLPATGEVGATDDGALTEAEPAPPAPAAPVEPALTEQEIDHG